MSTIKEKKGHRGYVTHQEFSGLRIPVPFQNIVLRDYCNRFGFTFKLSVSEYLFPNCFLQLEALLKQLPNLEGIVMASLFMLPPKAAQRMKIYQAVLDTESSLHFVLENVVISNPSQRNEAENLFLLQRTLEQCPKRIEGVEPWIS